MTMTHQIILKKSESNIWIQPVGLSGKDFFSGGKKSNLSQISRVAVGEGGRGYLKLYLYNRPHQFLLLLFFLIFSLFQTSLRVLTKTLAKNVRKKSKMDGNIFDLFDSKERYLFPYFQ